MYLQKIVYNFRKFSWVKVSTVEHLLATLHCRYDNAIVEIDNEEVPIMDGSSKIFRYF